MNKVHDEFEGYHKFKNEDGEEYGSFEVFWEVDDGKEGWYWWSCLPGCMPDGETSGPFATSREAYDDANG